MVQWTFLLCPGAELRAHLEEQAQAIAARIARALTSATRSTDARCATLPSARRAVAPGLYVYANERRGLGIAPNPGHKPNYDDLDIVGRVYGDRMPEP